MEKNRANKHKIEINQQSDLLDLISGGVATIGGRIDSDHFYDTPPTDDFVVGDSPCDEDSECGNGGNGN